MKSLSHVENMKMKHILETFQEKLLSIQKGLE
jgi:hypothetical protein